MNHHLCSLMCIRRLHSSWSCVLCVQRLFLNHNNDNIDKQYNNNKKGRTRCCHATNCTIFKRFNQKRPYLSILIVFHSKFFPFAPLYFMCYWTTNCCAYILLLAARVVSYYRSVPAACMSYLLGLLTESSLVSKKITQHNTTQHNTTQHATSNKSKRSRC